MYQDHKSWIKKTAVVDDLVAIMPKVLFLQTGGVGDCSTKSYFFWQSVLRGWNRPRELGRVSAEPC